MAAKFTYTDNEISEIVAKYQSGADLSVLAETYAKSVPSIRMKLVKLGVYQKNTSSKSKANTPAVKTGGFPKTKGELAVYYKAAHDAVGDAPF